MGEGLCIFYVGEKFVGYFTLIWAYAALATCHVVGPLSLIIIKFLFVQISYDAKCV